MTAPKTPTLALPPAPLDPGLLQRLPPSLRKVLQSTPEKEWPRLRAFLIESEEAGQLVDMLPEMTRVMKYCPARLLGRVGRREISAEDLDKAYTRLHDSLHGVRRALHGLLLLAGLLGNQAPGQGAPDPKATAPREPERPAPPPAPAPAVSSAF